MNLVKPLFYACSLILVFSSAYIPPPTQCPRQLRTPACAAARGHALGGGGWVFDNVDEEGHRPWVEWWVGAWRGGAAVSPRSYVLGKTGSSWQLDDNKLWLQRRQWSLRDGSIPEHAWGPTQGTFPHKGPGVKLSSRLIQGPHLHPRQKMVPTPPPWVRKPRPRQSPLPLRHVVRRQYDSGSRWDSLRIQWRGRSPRIWKQMRDNLTGMCVLPSVGHIWRQSVLVGS